LPNPVVGSETRDFWVWVDPRDRLARHNIQFTGAFVSPPVEQGFSALMLLPNPNFNKFVGAFQNNLVRDYLAEYNLELAREAHFPNFPSRLLSIFLLESESAAETYRSSHPEHVSDRLLKRVHAVGRHVYSVHDSGWVDFLRVGGSMDSQTLQAVTEAYWSGRTVTDCELSSMGQPWTGARVPEVLFMGCVKFYDRTLDADGLLARPTRRGSSPRRSRPKR
jgi:hypothetical protein